MSQAQHKTPFSRSLLMPTTSGNSSYEVVTVSYETNKRGQSNEFELKFYSESDEELRLKKEEALKDLKPVPQTEMDMDPKDFFPPELSFPHPPPRGSDMTSAQLDAKEQKYFKEYVETLQKSKHWKDISYFETNLQTWRQLWNVLEMCDILLLVVDVRYAGMMFPPSLYEYIRKVNKDMVLVLNKIDLIPPVVVASWQHYFTERYPGLEVVYFTSCLGYKLVEASTDKAGLQVRRRNGRQRMCIQGSTSVLDACKDLVKGQVELSAWVKKIRVGSKLDYVDLKDEEKITEEPNTQYFSHNKYKNGVLTVGCLGAPNVGKSSLINSIMGEKVVSVSRTPGHTKHFQTIYLTDEVRLCDCPGLVFPSLVPRAVQVLMGSYPIAQLREPYTTIRYLGERMDLPSLLNIQHPDNANTWSSKDICDGWAKKRGYLTSKEVKLDTYRAAKSLLRMALDGTLSLWVRPTLSPEEFEKIKTSEDINFIEWCQGGSRSASVSETDYESEDADDSGDTEQVKHIATVNMLAALANE